MSSYRMLLIAGVTGMVLVSATGASAQSRSDLARAADVTGDLFRRDRAVAVLDRPHEGYEALGFHEGSFLIYPRLTSTLEYNDNIFAVPDDKTGDAIWRNRLDLDVRSNWNRHSARVYGRTTFNQYVQNSSENTTDYVLGGSGKLDIQRTSEIDAAVDFSHLTEPRTASGSPQNLKEPLQYYTTSAFVQGGKVFNRLKLSGRFDWTNFNYQNGLSTTNTPIFENDRDRNAFQLRARADYAVSPDTAVFLQVVGNKREYRLDTGDIDDGFTVNQSRNSKGVEVLAGANWEMSALLRGEIGVGYLDQKYDDPVFNDIKGFGARGQVEWFPTQLMTVTFAGSRTVEDSSVAGSAGYLASYFTLQVDHELLRNLILSAQAGYGDDDYRGVDREDKRTSAGLSGTYLLNRNVGVTVSYNYLKVNSTGVAAGNDFTANRVGLGLTLQY